MRILCVNDPKYLIFRAISVRKERIHPFMKQSQYSVQDSKEGQFDFRLLWRVLVENLWKIVVVGVLSSVLLGSFRYLTHSKTYTSNVQFLISGMILTKIDNEYVYMTGNSTASTAIGSQFAMNAPSIIGGGNTLDKVYRHLLTEERKYADTYMPQSPNELLGMLRVSYEEQIVVVSITHTDPLIAMEVAEAFRCIVPGQMDYFYGIENKYNAPEIPVESGEVESGGGDGNPAEYENIKSVAKALNNVSQEDIVITGRGTALFAVIGCLVGAIVVYLVCFLRTYFDHTVYTEDDLKNHFTLPVVGQIPAWNNAFRKSGDSAYGRTAPTPPIDDEDASAERVSPTPPAGKSARKTGRVARSGVGKRNRHADRDYDGRLLTPKTPFLITEAFKSLRTNMCYTTKGERCPVYGISSAYVQAGKSLVMANLSISFAMMGKKVLLIDGDLRCPAQHKIFNITNRVHGFSDVLAGMCTYEDMELRDGGYPNLNILTCGKLPPNPAELLASAHMKAFLERARRDYDIIFIDLPPVSEVSDAGIISELVTGYVFVVRSAYSDRRMIEVALETMEGFEASMTGFILNDIDIKSNHYYKNQYYNYSGRYSKYENNVQYSGYSGLC